MGNDTSCVFLFGLDQKKRKRLGEHVTRDSDPPPHRKKGELINGMFDEFKIK
jgi:hypothetical protein